MGRVDAHANASQHQQGVEIHQFHQTPPETIDDAPPLDEDLYEPPMDYQPQSAGTTNNKPPPPAPTTQAFPPPQDHHPAAAVHSFPPAQDYEKPPPAQPFPPPHDNPSLAAQPFPPPQEQTAQPFPPSGNQYTHHHHQPPNVVAAPQFPAQQNLHHQPVAGGIPVGFSPSPFNPQQTQLPTQPWRTQLFDCMRNPQNGNHVYSRTILF